NGGGGLATLTGCTIADNPGPNDVGINSQYGQLTVVNCSITGNFEGLFEARNQSTTITGTTISGNRGGGGLALEGGASTVDGFPISDNSGFFGGVSDNFLGGPSTLSMAHCTITGNSGQLNGGGVDLSYAATLTDCTISGNQSQRGGGVFNQGT